ncbi:hypothetical protein [uncultured Thiodictyon sp.]|uniref:hypothetical protein n=1 Tax=uncultured Thiodictyon sp. TaxID=1846217 RepID=UPI0025FC078F|nr:hypothetical protein [uncultured Thiodictyon sp.]
MMTDTPTDNPAAALARVAAALEVGNLPDPDDRRRFADGVARWLNEGAADLEQALGLAGSVGRDSARTIYRRHLRDMALREAHGMMTGPAPWSRSVALADEIARFNSLVWPRVCHLSALPETPKPSKLRATLFAAARWRPLPNSVRAVHDICAPQLMGAIRCG